MLAPSKRISPSTRTLSTRSLSRLKQRSKVDFPQPDGPMNAVTRFSSMPSETRLRARVGPYQSDSASTSKTVRGGTGATASARWSTGTGLPPGAPARSSGGTTFMTSIYSYFPRCFGIGSYGAGGVAAAQAVAHDGCDEVHGHADQHEQQRGGGHQRLGRLDGGGLGADVGGGGARVPELAGQVGEP